MASNSESLIAAVRVLSVSHGIHEFLARPRRGAVLAIFARSCYLELDGGIVAVVAPDLLNGPLNVVVAPPGLTFAQLRQGMHVAASARGLTFENGTTLAMRAARIWNARLRQLPLTVDDPRRHLDAVRAVLTDAPQESLARHEQRSWRASEAISLLADGLRRRDAGCIAVAATRLAGLGPGLTPSGDDILVGTLVALTAWPSRTPAAERAALRAVIASSAARRTTRISAAYLRAAAGGEAGEAWHRLLAAFRNTDDSRTRDAARRVMAFGETSGADMLAGFVLASDAIDA